MTIEDPVARLSAGLAEDERIARAASPGPWHPNAEHDEVVAVDDITVCEGFALSGSQLRATVDHIVAQDPASTLRRVEAIRKVIAIAEQMMEYAVARDRVSPRAEKILLALTDIYPDTTETGGTP